MADDREPGATRFAPRLPETSGGVPPTWLQETGAVGVRT